MLIGLEGSDIGPHSSETGRGRRGSGVWMFGVIELGARLVALDMAAFSTWVKVGLIPQARHGGSGVCTFAVAGSKLDGTGFENVQIVQTHVAVLGGGFSTGGALKGLSERWRGEDVPFRDGADPTPGERACNEDLLGGFGIRVTLADDFRNPAYRFLSQYLFEDCRAVLSVRRTRIAQHPSGRARRIASGGRLCRRSIFDVKSGRPVRSADSEAYIC